MGFVVFDEHYCYSFPTSMNNLTHALTGVALGRSLGMKEKDSAIMMVLAANAPDIDLLGGFSGDLPYWPQHLILHRTYTHSFALAPLIALFVLLITRLFSRPAVTWKRYLACLLAVLSHVLLDWTNMYGIRFLLPFSSRWFRLDITAITDPWILAFLIIGVVTPFVIELRTVPHDAVQAASRRRLWALIALLAVILLDGGRWIAHASALQVLNSQRCIGEAPVRVTALPTPINPLVWRGIVECEGFVFDMRFDLRTTPDPGTARVDSHARPSAAIEAARKKPLFDVFGQFNQLPFWRVTELTGGAARVDLVDLRFGSLADLGVFATAIVESDGRVIDEQFSFGQRRLEGR
jgi:inner membrane protein